MIGQTVRRNNVHYGPNLFIPNINFMRTQVIISKLNYLECITLWQLVKILIRRRLLRRLTRALLCANIHAHISKLKLRACADLENFVRAYPAQL